MFFVHADSRPPKDALAIIRREIDGGAAGGAFSLAYEPGDRDDAAHRVVGESALAACCGFPSATRASSAGGTPTRRPGGFRDLAVCDDLDLVRRLKRQGRFVIRPEATRTSPRRYRGGRAPPGAPRLAGLSRVLRGRLAGAARPLVLRRTRLLPAEDDRQPRLGVAHDDDFRVRARSPASRWPRCPSTRGTAAERPCPTIFWKSEMPWASMRFRSASCDSFWRTNFICSASCSRLSFSWIALATIGGRPIFRRRTASAMMPRPLAIFWKRSKVSRAICSRSRGIESLRVVGRGDLADRRADLRMDDDLLVVLADRLVDLGGLGRIEPEEQRALELHHQTLFRGDLGRLLDFQRLDRHLDDPRERKDEVHAGRQHVRARRGRRGP